jgi:HEAT repeat protein
VRPLIAALEDQAPSVRQCAAAALGNIGDSRAIKPLIAALSGNAGGQAAAAEALGKIGHTRAVAPLIAALEETSASLRQSAAEALGKIADGAAVEPRSGALRDESWGVRRASAEALGEIGDVRAIGPLTELQDHLTKCPSDPFETPGSLLRAEDELRRSVARALRRLVGAAEAE